MNTTPATNNGAASGDEYRALMSAFPTGVAVVTGLDPAHSPCGMTCSSLTSVTVSPPTLLICLRLGSRTATAVRRRGDFAINLLHARARWVAELFSSPVGDRFGRLHWEGSPSGLPWLTHDAFAHAECVVTRSLEVGDHAVLFGQVMRVAYTSNTPLLYGMRAFGAWNTPTPTPTPRRLSPLRM